MLAGCRLSVAVYMSLSAKRDSLVGVIIPVAHAHYEMVFVAVAEQWVVRGYKVEKVVGAFRQIDIVDVYEVEIVATCVAAVAPLVFPCRSGYYSCVFRSFLIVERQCEFGAYIEPFPEPL